MKRNHPNLQQSLQDVVRVQLRCSNLRWRLLTLTSYIEVANKYKVELQHRGLIFENSAPTSFLSGKYMINVFTAIFTSIPILYYVIVIQILGEKYIHILGINKYIHINN